MQLSEEDFMSQIKKITEVDESLTLEMSLNNLELFDSLALMSIAAWYSDTYKKYMSVSELEKLDTLFNLYKLVK